VDTWGIPAFPTSDLTCDFGHLLSQIKNLFISGNEVDSIVKYFVASCAETNGPLKVQGGK